MTIDEEEFEGYHIVDCPKCGKNQVPYKKESEIAFCPVCNSELKKTNIVKTIKKKINRRIYDGSSVETSFFNY